MSYENFRTDVSAILLDQLPGNLLHVVISAIDTVATNYEVSKKSTELTVCEETPQIVKLYVASKAVENRSKLTLDRYLRTLKNFLNTVHKPFDQVSSNDIRSYLFKYKEDRGTGDSTIEEIRLMISGFYAWCVDGEYMERNPARRIAPIKYDKPDRQPMSSLELEKFRHACQTIREKAVVDFLYSTGCRIAEMTNVMIEDIDFQTRTVKIRRGKGGKHRTTYLNSESIVSLQDYLGTRDDKTPYLFVSLRLPHNKLSTRAVEDIIHDIEKRAGIKTHVTPHVFRHTAATSALRAGMPVEQVQRFLGHSNINTTMIYSKVDDSEVRASHQKYVS